MKRTWFWTLIAALVGLVFLAFATFGRLEARDAYRQSLGISGTAAAADMFWVVPVVAAFLTGSILLFLYPRKR